VIKKELNPIWNDVVDIQVPVKDSAILTFEVKDWNKVNTSKLLGQASIALRDLIPTGVPQEYSLILGKADHGKLLVKLFWYTATMKPSLSSKKRLTNGIKKVFSMNKSGGGTSESDFEDDLRNDLESNTTPFMASADGTPASERKSIVGPIAEESTSFNGSSDTLHKIPTDDLVCLDITLQELYLPLKGKN
jgi:hypothetical protein